MESCGDEFMEIFHEAILRMGKSEPRDIDGCFVKCEPNSIRRSYRRNFLDSLQGSPVSMHFTTSDKGYTSKSPFAGLNRTSIEELKVGDRAGGKYLVLRTIERACKKVSFMTIVEDHLGSVTLFAAYNFCSDFDADPEEVLPVGMIFILKEPYFKVPSGALQGSRECMLRCDSPTDVIVLNETHPLFSLVSEVEWKNDLSSPCENPVLALPRPQGAQEWKLRGNGLFKVGKITYARECYLMALKDLRVSDELSQVLHLNLAACHLRLQCFEDALAMATKVLLSQPKCEKALFRAGRACYELRKYRDAMKYYEKLHEMDLKNKEWKEEWKRTKERVEEEESGNVSIYKLVSERALRPRQSIDCSDFVGPIRVVPISGKGRGVVATEDIEPGRLLVVSKAFKIYWTKLDEFYMQVNADKTLDHGDNIKLVSAIAEAVMKNPKTFGRLVYDLSLGKHEAECRDSLKLFCDPDAQTEPIVDVQCIKHILNTNAFAVGEVKKSDYLKGFNSKRKEELLAGNGLFLFPSYFNHSCWSNAHWKVFNDVMIVRSTRFIKRGEEVSIAYIAPSLDFEERENSLKRRGFTCNCQLCSSGRQEPAKLCSKRRKLIADFNLLPPFEEDQSTVDSATVKLLEEIVSGVEATYTADARKNLCKMEMRPLYRYLRQCYSKQGRYNEAIAVNLKEVASFGFDLQELIRVEVEQQDWHILSKGFLSFELPLVIMELIRLCCWANRFEDVKTWTKVVIVLYKKLIGGDVKCVKLHFPSIANLIDMYALG